MNKRLIVSQKREIFTLVRETKETGSSKLQPIIEQQLNLEVERTALYKKNKKNGDIIEDLHGSQRAYTKYKFIKYNFKYKLKLVKIQANI